MKYMGSKTKYAKDMLAAMSPFIDDFIPSAYVEPFVGGANFIQFVEYGNIPKIGIDLNKFIIAMFQELQKGWLPPIEVTEEEYKIAMNKSKCDNSYSNKEMALIGFIGIASSYGGKWFGGYARGKDNKGHSRNYTRETYDNLRKQLPKIMDVKFYNYHFENLGIEIPKNSIIYCDPPYNETTGYLNDFRNDTFWNWCNKQVDKGHRVFVSEYTAPADWICIWQHNAISHLKSKGTKESTEKLFTKLLN